LNSGKDLEKTFLEHIEGNNWCLSRLESISWIL